MLYLAVLLLSSVQIHAFQYQLLSGSSRCPLAPSQAPFLSASPFAHALCRPLAEVATSATYEGQGRGCDGGEEHWPNRGEAGDTTPLSGFGGGRRGLLAAGIASVLTVSPPAFASITSATEAEREYMQKYGDFDKINGSTTGAAFKPFSSSPTKGSSSAAPGDRVVYEWTGYTIGYFGRPFEMKQGVKGGAFAGDAEANRCTIGDGTVVKALDLAMVGMKSGEGKQVIVPYGAEGYMNAKDDKGHARVGPTPTTFSGQRALDFVLDNPRLDRTVLINFKVVRVDKKNGKGFTKGD